MKICVPVLGILVEENERFDFGEEKGREGGKEFLGNKLKATTERTLSSFCLSLSLFSYYCPLSSLRP
jgi:hypothetical protein